MKLNSSKFHHSPSNAPRRTPTPHPSGARAPEIPQALVPAHVAVVMDGNGRWAGQRGLPRIAGHEAGELALLDCIHGAIELGVQWISAYGFSVENWKRPLSEINFIMRYVENVFLRRIDEFDDLGVRVHWAGRERRLWRKVVRRLDEAVERTQRNNVINLVFCFNYGARQELLDAVSAIAKDVHAGRLRPDAINERTLSGYLYIPDMPDVDLFIRTSGEQRISNFLLWQSSYAEFVFTDTLWPDFDRRDLWQACETFARRDRRFGTVAGQSQTTSITPTYLG